jgi:integrase
MQLAERLEWGSAWTDSGRVFTREDGTPLRPGLDQRAVWDDGRPRGAAADPVPRSAARRSVNAGVPPKAISEILGHATVAFTMDVYTEVAEELADAAASAIVACIPRRGHPETVS